jgi:hypothetical protein
MAHAKILEFRMPRPKVCRTQEEVDRVPRNFPVQIEFTVSPAEKMHDALKQLRQAEKHTARVLAKALDLAETELSRATKRVEHLRQLHGGYHRSTTVKAALG